MPFADRLRGFLAAFGVLADASAGAAADFCFGVLTEADGVVSVALMRVTVAPLLELGFFFSATRVDTPKLKSLPLADCQVIV